MNRIMGRIGAVFVFLMAGILISMLFVDYSPEMEMKLWKAIIASYGVLVAVVMGYGLWTLDD